MVRPNHYDRHSRVQHAPAAGRAAQAASRAIAQALREAEGLPTAPEVNFRGSFLWQASRGCFDAVDVSLEGLRRANLRIQRVDLCLEGVELSKRDLRRVVRGEQPSRLSVRHVSLRVLVLHDDLTAMLEARGLRVELGPKDRLRVHVLTSVPVLGQFLPIGADMSLRVEGTDFALRPERILTGTGLADGVVSAALGGRFDFRFEVGPLPVPLHDVTVTPEGLVLEGEGDDVCLDTMELGGSS
jgi:hypothetical protein